MRRSTHAAARPLPWTVPLLVAWGTASSCLAAPSAEELLAVGFHTPEQAFATFKTALRADLIDLEYRSLSGGFKRRRGVSQLVYETARERLFDEQPLMKLAARAEVVEREDLGPDRVRLTARVDAWFVERSFSVLFVREDFYETFDGAGLLEDGYVPWTSIASRRDADLVVAVPMPEGTAVDELVELRAGREWKLDGFEAAAP